MNPFDFSLAVLGCRANQEELDALRSVLLALGGRERPFPAAADLTLVNTCAVTASALAQSRQELRKAGRRQVGGQVWAIGCGAQMDPATLATLVGVDLVIGNRAKFFLPRLIEAFVELRGDSSGPVPLPCVEKIVRAAGLEASQSDPGPALGHAPPASRELMAAPILWSANPRPEGFLSRSGPIPTSRSRALVKIQDGCHHRCRYCIVPHLRGEPLSRPIPEILAGVGCLVEAGFCEIVLTGINLGLYGHGALADRDLPPQEHLPRLLRALDDVEGLRRIRLSSLEPMTLTPVLLDQLTSSAKVARHLHLPLQSGSDAVLARMGRPYRVAVVRELVRTVAERWPRFGLGVDLVAGFPGEREEDHRETLALIEELPVTYVHAFAYSERPGTPAAADLDTVPHAQRKQRVADLRAASERLQLRFQERLRGQAGGVVVERIEAAPATPFWPTTSAKAAGLPGTGSPGPAGVFTGTSGEYVRLMGAAPRSLQPGQWCEVVAEDSIGPGLMRCCLQDP